MDAFPDSSTSANSPVLGSSGDLWKIALTAARLSHNLPLTVTGLQLAKELRIQLQIWHVRLVTAQADQQLQLRHPTTSAPPNRSTQFVEGQQLYIVALRILLLTISGLEVDTDGLNVSKLVSEGVGLLREGVTHTTCSQFFCWPTLVIGSAASQRDHIAAIRTALADMWGRSYSDYVRRGSYTLELIWSTLSSDPQGECVSNIKDREQCLDQGAFDILMKLHQTGLAASCM